MKKIIFIMLVFAGLATKAQVGIGVAAIDVDASAQLEVKSTTKGLLSPRMTEAQKNAINTPATGLLIYQTDGTSGFYYYDGSIWKQGLGPQGVAGAAGASGQTNTSLLYSSMATYADGAAPADASSSVTSTYGNFGWYFKKTGNSKINWYIQPKSSSMKVSDLTGLYLELFNVAITSASDMPFITVYTKPTGSGDAGFWYKSRRIYTFSGSPAANTNYLGFANLGAASPNTYNTSLLNIVAGTTTGTFASSEDILTIAITSSSAASTCEFIANKFGVITGTSTQEFLFMPPSSIANLSSYATSSSLNTEVLRAQAAEAALSSSVNSLENNVMQNYATITSVNNLENNVMQNYATITSVNNLENNVMQNYATITSVNDLANNVSQNSSQINNLQNQNLIQDDQIAQLQNQATQSTIAVQSLSSALDVEVSRAQAAEATLTSSLATKANLASPSFTGVVTVGGTSSTASAAVEVSSTTQGFLPPRMTAAQRDAISSPAAGLVLWCSNCGDNGELNVYNGTSWTNMVGGTTSTAIIPPIVTIGSQIWMNVNLNVDRYRNGDPIPKVEDGATWESLTTGAYCYYNNDSATYAAKYGKLYNWYAVNDSRGLAPFGYHVPTKTEWETLISTAGDGPNAGAALKEVGTAYWNDGNPGATNSTGFSARGGGYRFPYNGSGFYYEKTFSYFWVSTPQGINTAYFYGPWSGGNNMYGDPYPYNTGFSVRLIRACSTTRPS